MLPPARVCRFYLPSSRPKARLATARPLRTNPNDHQHEHPPPAPPPMANNADILRYIDSIARDKEIDKEALIVAIEQAMAQALAKKYGVDDVDITLEREAGEPNTNYHHLMEDALDDIDAVLLCQHLGQDPKSTRL